MKKRLQVSVFYAIAVCFFIVGSVNLMASLGTDHLLKAKDPLSHCSYRLVLSIGGCVQLLASALLLMSRKNWGRIVLVSTSCIILLAYQYWSSSRHEPHIFSCVGNTSDWLPLSPRVVDVFLKSFYLLTIIGSNVILGANWLEARLRPRIPLVQGGRVEEQCSTETADRSNLTDPPLWNAVRIPIKQHSLFCRFRALARGWILGTGFLGVLVGSLHLKSYLALPPHFNEIVHEVCSVGDIRFAPLVNPDGTQILYGRDMEDGVGIFLIDLETLKRKEIRHISAAGPFRFDLFNLFGWSLDGRYLAFSTTTVEGEPNREIWISDGAGVKQYCFFTASESIRRGVWITTNSIALMGRSHRLYILNLDDERSGGLGEKGLHVLRDVSGKESNSDSAYSMARLSDHSFAFVEGNNLFSFDLLNNQITQLTFFDKATVIEWPAFNESAEQFLMCLTKGTNQNERYLYQFDLKSPEKALTRLTDSRSYKGQWINEGSGIQPTGVAYVGSQGNENYLAVKAKNMSLSTNLFLDGHIRAYGVGPKGDKLYAIASVGAEPMGIWEYSISSGVLRNVLPGAEKPFVNSRVVAPVKAVVMSDSGTNINYYYFPPSHVDPKKRYPVMIDSPRDSRWDAESQLVANSDIFYVSVNQAGLASFDIHSISSKDIVAVYRDMLRNPNVDSSRIYVAGVSWGTQLTSQLVQSDPTLWRGVILLSPVTLPPTELQSISVSSLFVSVGLNDVDEWVSQSEKLEKQVYANLRPAKFIFHKNAAHTMETSKLMMERYGPMIRFMLTDN